MGEINLLDPNLKAWAALTKENPPAAPEPGKDYGMEGATFRHPTATPLNDSAPAFPGQPKVWNQNGYTLNIKQIAFDPTVTSPSHAWPDVEDFDGRRYLNAHDRDYIRVLDITDPAHAPQV